MSHQKDCPIVLKLPAYSKELVEREMEDKRSAEPAEKVQSGNN